MDMTTLADFLLARIAEDEAAARAACIELDYDGETRTVFDTGRRFDGHWRTEMGVSGAFVEIVGDGMKIYDEGGHGEEQAAHIARHDPARVLAECEAKRRIVQRASVQCVCTDHGAARATDCAQCRACHAVTTADGYVLDDLALPYADHPDYQPEWRP